METDANRSTAPIPSACCWRWRCSFSCRRSSCGFCGLGKCGWQVFHNCFSFNKKQDIKPLNTRFKHTIFFCKNLWLCAQCCSYFQQGLKVSSCRGRCAVTETLREASTSERARFQKRDRIITKKSPKKSEVPRRPLARAFFFTVRFPSKSLKDQRIWRSSWQKLRTSVHRTPEKRFGISYLM